MTTIEKRVLRNLLMIVAGLGICLLIDVLFGSCTRNTYIPVQTSHSEQRIDTLRLHSIQRDTVVLRDSIVTVVRGDTVRIDRWHHSARIVLRVDSLYRDRLIAIRDTVPQAYPVEKRVEVPRHISWWQSALMWLGTIALTLVVVWLIRIRK